MLSIKGREPFIRMQLWLTDPQNIEKLQALKNERREANKRRRTNAEDVKSSQDLALYNSFNNNSSSGYSPLPTSHSQSGYGSSSGAFGAPSAKKPRILFSEEQKEALRLAFSMDPYPSTATIEFLASELALSVRTITNWFHNHRMRLKQVSNAGNDDSGAGINSLPFGLGRDGVSFDPNHFRVLLSQRMSDSRAHDAKQNKFSSLYGASPVSSHLYGNQNSCSSPGSSSFQEDDVGTLDLSMSSHQQKSSNRSLTDDSDNASNGSCDEDDDVENRSMELDLTRSAPSKGLMGSSRRKPQVVMSSSSRRKPAQPQWVDPGLEFSGDEDDDEMLGEEPSDDSEPEPESSRAAKTKPQRNEIINGVCVRQTGEGFSSSRKRSALGDDVDAAPDMVRKLGDFKEKMQQLQSMANMKKESEDWEDGDDDEDSVDGPCVRDDRALVSVGQTKDLAF